MCISRDPDGKGWNERWDQVRRNPGLFTLKQVELAGEGALTWVCLICMFVSSGTYKYVEIQPFMQSVCA